MGTISVSLPADGETIDAADYNTPITTIVTAVNGNLDNSNIATSAAIDGSKLADSSIQNGKLAATSVKSSNLYSIDGWITANETIVYASATTFTCSSTLAALLSTGDRIKLTQTTVKYFYVVSVSGTTVTITGGSDYSLANASITAAYYSHEATPTGFPGYFNWTPTWTNLTVGNGTTIAHFSLLGKHVEAFLYFTLGSTSAVGTTPVFTLPMAASSTFIPATSYVPIGQGLYTPAGIGVDGFLFLGSDGKALPIVGNASGTYLTDNSFSASVPGTWANTNFMRITFRYDVG